MAAVQAASRMLKRCKRTPFDPCPSHLPATNTDGSSPNFQRMAVIASSKRIPINSKVKKVTVGAKALVSESIISEPRAKVGEDLAPLAANVAEVAITIFRPTVRRKTGRLNLEMLIERVIMDCRLFALIAVAGSLLGSSLCFIKGCFHVLETYFMYFHTLSHGRDQGQTVRLLIEAIDTYAVGTAMLSIGIGLYVLFVGPRDTSRDKLGWLIPGFHLKGIPTWMQMQSVSQAKLKIGQAVVKILLVGLLENLTNVPMASGVDLACLAGTVLVSSATVFLLSKLAVDGRTLEGT